MSVDWTQPYILIFEWGLFILGWLLVFILSSVALVVIYGVIRAVFSTLLGRKPRNTKPAPEELSNVKRDIYGRFTL